MNHASMTLRLSAMGLRATSVIPQTPNLCIGYSHAPASTSILWRLVSRQLSTSTTIIPFTCSKSWAVDRNQRFLSRYSTQSREELRRSSSKGAVGSSFTPARCFRSYSTERLPLGELTEEAWRSHPDRFQHLSDDELAGIFGRDIGRELGNGLLQTLQMHRITGTLDHELELTGVTDALVATALEWLRVNYPLDEDAAIIRRIEAEEKLMEEQYIANADRYKLYKPQQRAEQEGLYGKSYIDALRIANKEKAEAREKEAEAKKEENDEAQDLAQEPTRIERAHERAVLTRRTESAEWVKAYKEKARLSRLSEPPKMSRTRRLLPSGIFALIVIGLCVYLARNYDPPVKAARFFPDTPPAAATILGIIGANILVFLLWRIPFCWRTMNKHFLLIPATPNPLSLLGNTFSHHGPGHLFANMLFLWFLGTRLHDDVGRGNFVAVYLIGGVFASYVSLTRFVLANNLVHSSLGASGAVTSVVAAYLSIHSGDVFGLAFLPKDSSPTFSAGVLLLVLLALEILGIARGLKQIDHFAHLGGYAAGIAGAEALKYRARINLRERGQKESPTTHGQPKEASVS